MESASVSVETKIGTFILAVECEGIDRMSSLRIEELTPGPALPEGYAVERCIAFVACIRSAILIPRLRWMCKCLSNVKGYPDTGEHLDAQDWKGTDRRVMVGTEDSEMLARRLPFISLARDKSLMHYSPDRMELLLKRIPAEFDLSLHYVLAENPWPEPVVASTWFAVDIRHRDLLDLLR